MWPVRAVPALTLVAVFSAAALATPSLAAGTRGRAPLVRSGHAATPARRRAPVTVAVQPFEGPASDTMRALIVRIVRGRGLRAVTSIPRMDGTAQYPSLARDHHLAAFVTADVEERGRWQSVTFLVWNGTTGSVVGRWTAGAPGPALGRAVGRGFWQHLGPALRRTEAPESPRLDEAPPMRIDASNADDNSVATRE